tara:strand:+ start:647 stop:871 length:225 start_codon:yes stop_codon:yes gene_type:complete
MKVGDLIKYIGLDDDYDKPVCILGIIVKDLGYYETYREDAVSVHWFDDNSTTAEKVSVLLDKDEYYIGICSKGQ